MIDKEFIQYYGQKFKVDLHVVLEDQIVEKDMSRLVGSKESIVCFILKYIFVFF